MMIRDAIAAAVRWVGESPEQRVTLENPSTNLHEAITGGLSRPSRVTVNERTAMRLGAVYACVRARAETMASMPLRVVRRAETGEVVEEVGHPLSQTLRVRANPTMTAYSFVEYLAASIELTGNGYGLIERDPRGFILTPLRPDVCELETVGGEKLLKLQISGAPKPETLGPGEFFHIPHMVLDGGVRGASPIRVAAQSMGISLAAAATVEAYYGRGSRNSAVVETERKLDKDARKRLQAKLHDAIYANDSPGPDSRFGLVLLDEAMKYKEIGVPATDALLLDAMKAGDHDVARIFRTPPHKIGLMDKATFSNIEHQNLEWIQDSILPGATRFEQEMTWSLLDRVEVRDGLSIAFDESELIRGDMKTRSEVIGSGRQWGWLSPNDARQRMSLPKRDEDGADDLHLPVNMVPLGDNSIDSALEDDARARGQRAAAAGRRELAELRARIERSAAARIRVRNAMLRLFEQAAQRLVNFEVGRLLEALNRTREQGLEAFATAAERVFQDVGRRAYSELEPAILALTEAIMREAALEFSQDLAAELVDEFARSASRRFAAQHRGRSQAQLAELAERDGALDLIEERLGEWRERRGPRVAREQAVGIAAGAARAAYVAFGVTLFRWVATGDNCPICVELDGRIVGAEEPFVAKGGEVGDPEKITPARMRADLLHAPAHDGCDCSIVPEVS